MNGFYDEKLFLQGESAQRIYNEIKELKSLLSTIKADTYIITGTGANPLLAGAKREICGMLRPLTNENPPDDVFIGITLN